MKKSEAGNLSPLKKITTIFILSLALAIIIIDTTLLNVSLSTIIRDFKTDIQSIQWVITAYSLTLAALTITGGRLGDLFGRKKMFVVGAIIFAFGSFIASISQNVPSMIIGESLIEGVGAALMMPATSSLLMSIFKGRDRALAFGVWGGVAGASAALGPILGGFLTTYYSWRLGFRINVFIAALLCLGAFFLPEVKEREEKPSIDWLGVFLSSIGLILLVFGIIESSRYGWFVAKESFMIGNFSFDSILGNLSVVPFAIDFGLFFLSLFCWFEIMREEMGKTPLVSMRLFQNRQYLSGVLTTMILSLGQAGMIFALPVFLQAVRGYDAFKTGLSLLPMSLTLLVVSPLAAFLSGKIRAKWIIQTGLLINLLGMLVLRNALSVEATFWSLAPGLILFGAGMGFVMSQVNNLTLSAVSVEQAGEASGVSNTLRQLGSSLGSAIIGAILISSLTTNLTNGINESKVIPPAYKPTITSIVDKHASDVEFGSNLGFETNIQPVLKQEITRIGHQATVDANKSSLLLAAFFALLGFLVSFLLPASKNLEKSESLVRGH